MTFTHRLIVAAALTLAVGFACFVALSAVSLQSDPKWLSPRSPRRPANAAALIKRVSADVACEAAPRFAGAASANRETLQAAQWSIAGPAESGWRSYAPLVAREVGTDCGADQPAFARAVARWQGSHGLTATGVMGAGTLRAMYLTWLRRRPFITATRDGSCPPPPPEDQLERLRPEESYAGKVIRLQVRALEAYRRLVAAARADLPSLNSDPRVLTVFSGYRGPAEEAARCSSGSACDTVARARCSAHRTGLALDIFLAPSPGSAPDATDEADRVRDVQSPAYQWLLAHADQFGFVPYPYEPWHWEFTG